MICVKSSPPRISSIDDAIYTPLPPLCICARIDSKQKGFFERVRLGLSLPSYVFIPYGWNENQPPYRKRSRKGEVKEK